ncbi:WecB/TagA/CpsF family glycosyltransferase [Bacillus cereus group sp. MYBK245-2]|uniref:Putative N-acetylmannosaminyltransferase n=2 Tax=Bacteria TaxID=2 RepID=A0A1Y5Z2C4_9BACI|nr:MULTISPECIES: WecB/TagA/CpsF family glycosyltransferase [Bacillus cereus group]PEB03861.1 glycosyltransferase [Bacillus cereus]MCZ7522055.1 WecB/TagA/CpsF family glycosyltransferase [Bacillus pacificus]MDA1573906.1 WecB/TagA/CpsF family glycosyltransferase [Bacillus cereus group sp. TH242-3LC]MED1586514.1 WecB/TagA/CpsF family glycosyltransferase [Bacillus pacificus]RRB01449.1 glycosyltransferase [Bacillus pacificus]
MDKKIIGDIQVNITNEYEVIEYLDKRINKEEKTKVFFLNAHCFNVAQANNTYKENINNAHLLLNDGIGLDIASKLFGFKFPQNMNGTDFTPKLLEYAEKQGLTVYLLGGEPGVVKKAQKNFEGKFEKLNIVGSHHGYFFDDEAEIIEDINKHSPDILIVGFGVPLQENWISKHFEGLNTKVLIGVGAFLDFSANKVRRAPKWMRTCKLEWVFRLLLEPKRMFKRYVIGIPLFLLYIVKYRIKS